MNFLCDFWRAHQKLNSSLFPCNSCRQTSKIPFILPLIGRIKTSHSLFPLVLAADQFVCHTEAVADIVILVDGSWSIGRLNFRLVRMFLENLVGAFDIGIDKTRVGEWLTVAVFFWTQLHSAQCKPYDELCHRGFSRSGPVQRRSQDWVAPELLLYQGRRPGRGQKPALQGRKHTHRYVVTFLFSTIHVM